jgi:hypothetical protein
MIDIRDNCPHYRLLDLFAGTHSVSKVAAQMGYEVVSLDLSDKYSPTIVTDILTWDYTVYPRDHFHVIWASPPCTTFSMLRRTNIGRPKKGGGVHTKESMEADMHAIGVPVVERMKEIIAYFEYACHFIENPGASRIKEFLDDGYYVVDYCQYADWGYRKRTNIWTPLNSFVPKTCNCKSHAIRIGFHGNSPSRDLKYRVPPALIHELLTLVHGPILGT